MGSSPISNPTWWRWSCEATDIRNRRHGEFRFSRAYNADGPSGKVEIQVPAHGQLVKSTISIEDEKERTALSLDKTISFGICMDINPDDFKAPFTAYEFGSHVLAQKSDLILFACAWNDFEAQDVEPYATLSYWAQRLSPVIDALAKGEYMRPNCHFLCSNRTGTENGTFFVGASCVLSLKEPAVVAHAGRRTEGLLRVEIPDEEDAVEQE